jgi:hypothetical protein
MISRSSYLHFLRFTRVKAYGSSREAVASGGFIAELPTDPAGAAGELCGVLHAALHRHLQLLVADARQHSVGSVGLLEDSVHGCHG